MGSRHSTFLGFLSLLGSAIVPLGCGNRGNVEGSSGAPCQPGKSSCLSAEVGQICNGQGQWATFQCGTNRRCDAGACTATGVTCSEGERACLSESVGQLCTSDQTYVAFACSAGQVCRDGGCRDTCVPNTHECAAESLQQLCRNDGAGWLSSECPTGTTCSNGACEGSCEAGSALCVTSELLRVCRSDATGYNEQQCPASMSCADGKCVSKSSLTCTFGQDVCLNETTRLECMRDGSGYTARACPNETRCRGGKCMGSACAAGTTACVGSNTADFTGVQTCNDDGAGYSVSICLSAGKCVQNLDDGKHECYVPPCVSGTEVCGAPNAAEVSKDYLSRCETLANGKLGWVPYKCDLPSVCKSTTAATAAACHTECSPGDQRCSTDGTAVEVCSADAEWVASSCSTTGGTDSVCVFVPSTQKAVCGDKDCRTLQTSVNNYSTRGRCSSTQIRQCREDGRLGPATACEEGQCVVESDGLGSCTDPTRCQHDDGWRECIASKDAYRTCQSGHWEFTLCAEGALCTDAGEGLVTCGDDCIAGKVRCVGTGYQTCSGNGTWGATQTCSIGECDAQTNRCETACATGQLRCVGDVVVASDGTSLGSRAVQRCTSAGSWGSTEPCATWGGEAAFCRRSGMGEHLGCVQCVGPAVAGGNEEGAVDSRCNADTTGYQTCQVGNTWPTSTTACTGTEHCAKQRDGSITGTCSNYGCTTGKPKRCVGYEAVTTSVSVDDCCAGECDSTAGTCLHRKTHYDPTCVESTSCFTGRYDADGAAINESCCTGFCRSGQGCLKVKARACDAVVSCAVTKVDHTNVCCGTCLTSGICAEGGEALHAYGEYFACGFTSNICWEVGSCTWKPSGSTSGAMFANCIE